MDKLKTLSWFSINRIINNKWCNATGKDIVLNSTCTEILAVFRIIEKGPIDATSLLVEGEFWSKFPTKVILSTYGSEIE